MRKIIEFLRARAAERPEMESYYNALIAHVVKFYE